MNNESLKLRLLAEAIDRLEALQKFQYQVPVNEFQVSWNTGSAVAGYREMSVDIATIVGERYQGLRLEAIAKAEKEVALRRSALGEESAP